MIWLMERAERGGACSGSWHSSPMLRSSQVTQITAGVDISMVVVDDGGVFAWGRTKNGRNGLGMQEGSVTIPRQVQLGDHTGLAVDVEAAYVHSLIVLCTGETLICGGVGVDDSVDGAGKDDDGLPRLIREGDINCWQRGKEVVEVKKVEKYKKYGKYETKGRTAMLAERDKWGV